MTGLVSRQLGPHLTLRSARSRVAIIAAVLMVVALRVLLTGLRVTAHGWSGPMTLDLTVTSVRIAHAWQLLIPALLVFGASVLTMFGTLIWIVRHPVPAPHHSRTPLTRDQGSDE